jgi:hypothetical protein
MDGNGLMLSFLFGLIGSGLFLYGKRAGRMVPLGTGVALIAVPYFIPNVIVLLIVCCGLSALPWVFRNA